MVRLRAVGICGSDLHWYEDFGIGATAAVRGMILGHEPVGEVVAVGKGVDTHKTGEKVAIEPSVTCGHCEYCRSGRPNNCPTCVFMGGPQAPGFFREYAVVPARNAEHFPADMDFLTATLIEPTAVIVHIFELHPVRIGDTVAILGAGPIGLLCANMARMAGASRIFIADQVTHRLRIARQMDEQLIAINTRTTSVAQTVMDGTNGRGADVVFDAAGAPDTIQAGIEIARPSATYVLIGISSQRMISLDIHAAMNKELKIQTVKRSNHKGLEATELIKAGKIPDLIITHRLPIENTPEGFDIASHRRDGVGKLVIEMQ